MDPTVHTRVARRDQARRRATVATRVTAVAAAALAAAFGFAFARQGTPQPSTDSSQVAPSTSGGDDGQYQDEDEGGAYDDDGGGRLLPPAQAPSLPESGATGHSSTGGS